MKTRAGRRGEENRGGGGKDESEGMTWNVRRRRVKRGEDSRERGGGRQGGREGRGERKMKDMKNK